MSTTAPNNRTSRRLLYAAFGALIAVGTVFLLAVTIVAVVWAAKSAGLTMEDGMGIFSFIVLACSGGALGWMYAKSREP